MIVWVADAHTHVQRLISVVKMATELEECNTEEQRLLWAKGHNAKIFTKKCFLFTLGSVCRVKSFTTGWQIFR
jgi:hypothetical protein